jgi:small subunit ribosomal protein S5
MATQTQQKPRRFGRTPRAKSEFDSKLVDLSRVTRVGVGIAKGADVAQAVEKATRKAQKSLITVPMTGGTIPHEVQASFGASQILLRPQRQGRGLVAGGVARIICEKAGIKNISAKMISRSRNKLNNAFATLAALQKLSLKEQPKAAGETKTPEPAQAEKP